MLAGALGDMVSKILEGALELLLELELELELVGCTGAVGVLVITVVTGDQFPFASAALTP